jgi:LmbE family N-acetylglucosaminyl deacetylase
MNAKMWRRLLKRGSLSTSSTVNRELSRINAVPVAVAAPGVRIANRWGPRLRRWVRGLITSQPPAADGWKPAAGHVMVIAPHPDDEVIGCGGTICRHVAAGDAVSVLYLTRGESSRGYPWLSPAEKQAKRQQEALASCAILGVRDTLFFDGEDGNLNDADVMASLSAKVKAAILQRSPRVIYVPHADDNHADHIAAYRMIMDMVDELPSRPTVYQYELWSPLSADFAVDISNHMAAKVKAIKRHQLALDAFDYVSTMIGLGAYRSGTMLQRKGYAEAFRRSSDRQA